MLHRVAKTLGRTVTELQYVMTSKELNSWARYFQHEPTNSVEIQLAYLTYKVSDYMGAKNKKVEDYIITSYRPPKKDQEPTITSEQLLSAWGFGNN